MTALQAAVLDWGGTLMRLLPFSGPMAEWPRVELVPGVADALSQLSRDLICCVATNAVDSDRELLGLALERGGIRQHFRYLFTPRELGALKPSPAFFGRILATIGVEPAASVMVGDDYVRDVAAARAVGMRTVWFAEAPLAQPAPCADVVIDAMVELPAALVRLRAGGAAERPG